jgi:hypothetical protein
MYVEQLRLAVVGLGIQRLSLKSLRIYTHVLLFFSHIVLSLHLEHLLCQCHLHVFKFWGLNT